jgi:Domain of unknown function (DUF4365)
MADVNNLQCEFSIAYVRAVASAAGFWMQEASRAFDADGIDLMLMARGEMGLTRSPKLEVQLKSFRGSVAEDPFPYDLAVKNYDELRDGDGQLPRILVLVVIPQGMEDWVSHDEDQLLLRRCGYWLSLRGQPATENTSTIRVKFPRSQVFDVVNLQGIMERVGRKAAP